MSNPRLCQFVFLIIGLAAAAQFQHASNVCTADLVDLTFRPYPKIVGANGTVSYDVTSGNLRIETEPTAYQIDRSRNGVFDPGGSVTIDVFIDQNGDFVANGEGLAVWGCVDFDGDSIKDNDKSTPILLGNITDFGAENTPSESTASLAFNGNWKILGGAGTGVFNFSAGGSAYGGFPRGMNLGGFSFFSPDAPTDFLKKGGSYSISSPEIAVVIPEPHCLTTVFCVALLIIRDGRLRRHFLYPLQFAMKNQ